MPEFIPENSKTFGRMNKFKLANGVVAKSFLLASLAAGHVFLFCPRASKTLGGASRETVGTWSTKLKVFGHALSTVREPPFTDRGIKQGTPTTTLWNNGFLSRTPAQA